MTNRNGQSFKDIVGKWKRLVIIAALSSYLLIFSEWLFLITMPSFFSSYSVSSNISTLLISGGVLAVVAAIPILFLAAIDIIFATIKPTKIFIWAASGLPAVILAVLIMLLVDNFTYTVFKFGIVSTVGWERGIYACAFIFLFFYVTSKIAAFVNRPWNKSSAFRLMGALALGLIVFSLILAGVNFNYQPLQSMAAVKSSKGLPNIIVIGSDGVNAANMSVYGYQRNTTPFLSQMSPSMLMAEDAFPNAAHTSLSVITILAGRLPPETGILSGEEAYQHLPGILRMAGYYNVEFGVPNYLDAYDMNFQNGFDVVNGRSVYDSPVFRFGQRLGYGESTYFLSVVFGRVSDRLLHIFYIRKMVNVYQLVNGSNTQVGLNDQEKIDQLIKLFSTTHQPLFVHMHLMTTHGPVFYPSHSVYSKGEKQTVSWMTDFYDDAVLDFDSYLKQLFDALKLSGKLDNTLIVIYTDHNMNYQSDQRIPLMIYFPGGAHSGVLKNNAQNMDIAPTILDYLGIAQPEWMVGQSLLRGEPPAHRLILSGTDKQNIRIVDCQRWYRIDGLSGMWFTGNITGSSGLCPESDISSAKDLPTEIVQYLSGLGVKVQDIPGDAQAYSNYVGVITRGQFAEAILHAKYGVDYSPSPAKGIFSDVPLSDPNASWIEQVYRDGIIGSCAASPLSFCPQDIVTRGDAAMYLIKAVKGGGYKPPSAKGIFQDVPIASPLAPWIEDLYKRQITVGCSASPLSYCPKDQLTREALVLFLGKAFSQP